MKTFIFDFDGTLADSFSLIRDIVIQESVALNCRQLTLDDISMLREMDAKTVFHYLEVPFWRRMAFIRKLRQFTHNRIHDICLFSEWPDILEQLYSANHQLGIISSNSHQTVDFVLNQYKIAHLFEFIHCDTSLFGKKKCLSQVIYRHQLTPDKTCYIGDEVRDIKAAQANNIQAIAVGWGFNSVSKLQAHKPHQLIESFVALRHFLGLD
jgi:phosphoglycolate phosphatase